MRVNRARSSRNASASSTAARCAATTASWVSGSARAHRTVADFGAVNVRSNPATAPRWGLASSIVLDPLHRRGPRLGGHRLGEEGDGGR